MVGFWADSCKMAQDEHLTTGHVMFRSTILGVAMFIFKLNWTKVKGCFSKIF